MREYIDAAAFKEMILCADAALHANIQAINDLNVFPVPDGDTGTNMGLTINNAAAELRKRSFDSVAAVSDCVAGAMLRGARGNSGVILSLLFRGIAKRLKGIETAGAEEFAGAMNDGVEAAYKAVMKPAEGTILTVSRLASAAAVKAAKGGADLENTLVEAIRAGDEALEDTLNQNPVLKKAGVIDAGGKGYMVILTAILASLRGEIASGKPVSARDFQEDSVFVEGKVDVPEINIFDTVFVVRKKEPNVDLEPLLDVVDISRRELQYVQGEEPGVGLLRFGKTIVPFNNNIPKESRIYDLFNTNQHEKIAEGYFSKEDRMAADN